MERQKAIEVLNSMEIIDSESDAEVMIFIYVENSEENREKVMSLGFSELEVDMGANDHKAKNDVIDLNHFAWNFAEWFEDGNFFDHNPNDY